MNPFDRKFDGNFSMEILAQLRGVDLSCHKKIETFGIGAQRVRAAIRYVCINYLLDCKFKTATTRNGEFWVKRVPCIDRTPMGAQEAEK